LATLEDCVRIQKNIQSNNLYTYCVQVNMKAEK
jgi:hypothetical protein